jgi:hypothetical protein
VSGQLHILAALPTGNRLRYPSDRLGGPQSRFGHCGEWKNLAMRGIEPGPSSPSQYRLSYPDFCLLVLRLFNYAV